MDGQTLWAQQCEARVREMAAEFEQRQRANQRGSDSVSAMSASELRQGIVEFQRSQATAPAQGPLAPDTDPKLSDEAKDRHNQQYLQSLLQKSPASLTAEERQYLREAISAFRG